METVKSKDGTEIAFARTGQGPPMLLVHGGTADHARWAPLLPTLNQHFTVCAVDRRGRGGSGNGPSYSHAREFEDLAAVIDSLGAKVTVLGHSFRGLCALEAMLLTRNVARLILYEPPIPTGEVIFPPGIIEKLEAMVARGDGAGTVSTFFTEVVKMPATELQMLQRLPNWPARVASATTIPREMRAVDAYVFVPERFRALSVPTLLLLGGESPSYLMRATEAVHAAIAGSRIAVMPGQQHTAINTATELFLKEVLGFALLR